MTSLAKMLQVLTLFTASEPLLTADEIMQRLNYTRPTTYRYLRELCAAGLLGRFANGYALGPRVIELDYIIRQADPVLKVARGRMRALAERYDCEVVLLTMFGAKVVTVHEEKSKDSPQVSYGRGHPMPMFRGAGSKVLMAHLPAAKLKKLFTRFPQEVNDSNLENNWVRFHGAMRRIRAAGHAISLGELDPSNVGVGAPIVGPEGIVQESLVLILSDTRYQTVDHKLLIETVHTAAQQISQQLAASGSLDELGFPLALAGR